MAEQLKREYDIVVLKAEAWAVPDDGRSDEPQVRFTLQFHEGQALHDGPQWWCPLAALVPDLPERGSRGMPVQDKPLPPQMLAGLNAWYDQEGDRQRPLWLHLVKPYGALRRVAWERVLGGALGVPLLMLPDFIFPPPRETLQVLDVALCGSAPLGYETISVYDALRQAAERIVQAMSRRVRLHVFTDRDIAQSLSQQWASRGWLDELVFVHSHDLAAPFVEEDLSSRMLDQAGTIRSPWLLWMREALAGLAVDVLHFVCHGHLARERGALLFAQSPLERSDRYLAGPVGSVELGTFLTQVGAWSTVFSSLPDNHSEPGLRSLADEIAQTRPGPMMMHVLREDPQAAALGPGYAFLYGLEPQEPPRSPALFVYCQPYLSADARCLGPAATAAQPERAARGVPATRSRERAPTPAGMTLARNAVQQEAAEMPLEASPLDSLFGAADHVSPLVASTERFAEQVQLRYQQLARDEVLPTGGAAEVAATFQTLDKLRAAVADLEARSPTPLPDVLMRKLPVGGPT